MYKRQGRYHETVAPLSEFFSEYALNKYRIEVEIKYLLFFLEKVLKQPLPSKQKKQVLSIIANFTLTQANIIKEIEQTTRHDVKAVEYYIRDQLNSLGIPVEEYIHFALTSEDTNSMAVSLSLKQASEKILIPTLVDLYRAIARLAKTCKSTVMLARTHGQPAVPTTLGKEMIIYALRIKKLVKELESFPIEAKLTGAVGNFNAFHATYPKTNWLKLSDQFIISLGLTPNHFTTQILPADNSVRFFQVIELINAILIGFDQDIWRYISDGYFLQKLKPGEVGSSTMPQKINPIDFENSEGNLGLANALFHHFSTKLPISRLQRDLSDSTVKRNVGSAFGYSLIAYQSTLRGLQKISPNTAKIKQELDNHYEVVAEGIQTVLRSTGDKQAYEKLKAFSQGKAVTAESVAEFISSLSISDTLKKSLLDITPFSYIGLAVELVDEGLQEIYESKK